MNTISPSEAEFRGDSQSVWPPSTLSNWPVVIPVPSAKKSTASANVIGLRSFRDRITGDHFLNVPVGIAFADPAAVDRTGAHRIDANLRCQHAGERLGH